MYIYGLVDPRDKRVRYVGKSVNPWYRLSCHLKHAPYGHFKSCKWINGLLKLGLEPSLVILQETDEAHWAEAEVKMIAKYRKKYKDLTNHAPGGTWHPAMKRKRRKRTGLRMVIRWAL